MIFVTGGTGLVGAHILLKLSQRGEKIKALKRSLSNTCICRNIFIRNNALELFNNIIWVDGDITNIVSLQDGMKDCTYIIHCAGIVSFDPLDKEILRKINIEGTANVMNIALSLNMKKVAYVSSVAALGSNPMDDNIVNEEIYSPPTKDASYYAYTKYHAEQEVWRGNAEGMDIVIVNPSIILGPGDWNRGSAKIFQAIHKGLSFYTEGSFGYVDVIDVAEALIQLTFSNIKNERFILNAVNIKYRDIFDRIAKQFNKPLPNIRITPLLQAIIWRLEKVRSFFTRRRPLITKETCNMGMKNRAYSSKKIQKRLDFTFINIDLTIKKYCDWYLSDLS